ncbi:MAG TPA: iron-sulfur cluster repair di-iron protein [Prolixibacteraceae bacterium]|jgi:regulator of cell morphogenesis and NO signaling|nr:iron-sulfur cluster repair di-iron protein [Prolixibacteraceae bacterium]
MNLNLQTPVGEIARFNYKTVEVFEKLRIDFCCGGDISLEEACKRQKVDANEVLGSIKKLIGTTQTDNDRIHALPLDQLIDHIVKVHHSYVLESIPVLQRYLHKITDVHGANHPELAVVEDHFNQTANNLLEHMQKEERILFPTIKEMLLAKTNKTEFTGSHCGTVQSPISVMKQEHEAEGDRFEQISSMTQNYLVPADACNTFSYAYQKLQEFEQDLHRHIHLENNILFPEAIKLEKELINV